MFLTFYRRIRCTYFSAFMLLATVTAFVLPGNAIGQDSESQTISAVSTDSTNTALIDKAPWRARSDNEQVTRTLFPVDSELGLSRAVRELAAVIAATDSIRLVTILGRNDIVNLSDLLFLQGVDTAVVRADAVEFVKRQNEFPGITRVVNTLARLHEQKLVVLANANIESIYQLEGKRVASGVKGSGEFVTASLVLEMLEVSGVEHVEASKIDAVNQLKNGDVDALFYLMTPDEQFSGQDTSVRHEVHDALSQLTVADHIKVLSLPLNDDLSNVYTATQLSANELPGLLEPDKSIPSLAVQVILAGYRWNPRHPRYKMAARFAQAFMDSTEDLSSGDNATYWANLDFKFTVPGIEQLNTVTSIYDNREAQQRAALLMAEARKEEQIKAQRKALEFKQVEIETIISQLLGNAAEADDFAKLQEISDQLDAIVSELSSNSAEN